MYMLSNNKAYSKLTGLVLSSNSAFFYCTKT